MDEKRHHIIADFLRGASEQGLDLVQPFDVRWYNDALAGRAGLLPLEDFGRGSALGLLVASTRRLWPPFLRALREDPRLQASAHPIDDYTGQRIAALVAGVPCGARVYSAHPQAAQPVSLLLAAEVSGLATRSATRLVIHSTLGLWFGLRAMVTFDLPAALQPARPESPCTACARPCEPAMQRALDAYEARGDASIAADWELWVAVRDACPVGREHRYDPAQLHYHYTKDLTRLRAAAR